MPPRSKSVLVGVVALADEISRESGVVLNQQVVSRKLKQGKSREQIREEHLRRCAAIARGERVPGKVAGGNYTKPFEKMLGANHPHAATWASSAPASAPVAGYGSYQPGRAGAVAAMKPAATLPIGSAPTPPFAQKGVRVSLISNPTRTGRDFDATNTNTPRGNIGEDDEYGYDDAIADHEQSEQMASARLRRAIALADKQELENAVKRGELVPVVDMRNWGTRFIIQAKDEGLKLPGELMDMLAAETNPVRCGEIVRQGVVRVLEKLYQLEELWAVKRSEESDKAAA